MGETTLDVSGLAAAVRAGVEEYAGVVREMAGANAKALIVYGAAVSESFDRGRHSIQNVLVLEAMDLAFLRALAERGAMLGRLGIAAPLVMTPAYIESSRDTFPLELIEIQQRHAVVFGPDYFRDLQFEAGHVRLQCERELKVSLIALREGLLIAAGRAGVLAKVLTTGVEQIVRALRGLLWLQGQKEGRAALEIVEAAEGILQRKLAGLRTALDPRSTHGWSEFEEVYHDVEAVKKYVDAWKA